MTKICNYLVNSYINCKQKYDNYEDVHTNCNLLFKLIKTCTYNFPYEDD